MLAVQVRGWVHPIQHTNITHVGRVLKYPMGNSEISPILLNSKIEV